MPAPVCASTLACPAPAAWGCSVEGSLAAATQLCQHWCSNTAASIAAKQISWWPQKFVLMVEFEACTFVTVLVLLPGTCNWREGMEAWSRCALYCQRAASEAAGAEAYLQLIADGCIKSNVRGPSTAHGLCLVAPCPAAAAGSSDMLASTKLFHHCHRWCSSAWGTGHNAHGRGRGGRRCQSESRAKSGAESCISSVPVAP